ncbi:MAG: polyphenol oxidase family protein [Longimicrobiales bacterium]|nr:polyphenol oxidase family protein [Longimicrobiales bacterium]
MADAPTQVDPEVVRERPSSSPPALVHHGWLEAFPWLVQGTTVRHAEVEAFDLGLFGEGASGDAVRANWARLLEATGMRAAVHARQPHGAVVRVWDDWADAGGESGKEGAAAGESQLEPPHLQPPCDGHATDRAGVLLAVTAADCVPVFMVDPQRRAVAMVHAGWRGAAAGVLEAGLDTMRVAFGTRAPEVHLHLGPSICGSCYEVGPEVFQALGRPVPRGPEPIDLRAVLGERAVEAGVDGERISVSGHCTLCTDSGLFSHRGGDAGRQVGYLGVRAGARR